MTPIATYVFLDLETTGLPREENNKTKITELSFVAVKRNHVLDTRPGATPRVQHKLTLCFNPRKMINPSCSDVTGLCNDLLEHEPTFNIEVFNMLNNFLNVLSKPVCLIAQNGLNFDFPILKNHLEKLNVSFGEDIMCADCYHAFYDILNSANKANIVEALPNSVNCDPLVESRDETDLTQNDLDAADNSTVTKETSDQEVVLETLKDTLAMKNINETTPKRAAKVTPSTPRQEDKSRISKACRRFPWAQTSRPTQSYKLKDIYERLLNRPALDAHRAENDCILALECSITLSKQFVEWIDENHVPFSDIKAMTIGVPLGLLTLTGALWGVTNPFIKAGTKGLRDVSAGTWWRQAWAELVFLLGNWRYVVPFLVNQLGSLAYLAALRRAPLSAAAPAANGLAFAFTALAGAWVGRERPLDRGSILGITLIVAGTALCCWDKTDEDPSVVAK